MISFDEACYLITVRLNCDGFKLIKKYHPDIDWLIKFEKDAKLYNVLEMLAWPNVPKDFRDSITLSDMNQSDAIILEQICSGVYRKFVEDEFQYIRDMYNDRIREFTRISNIDIAGIR